MRDASAAPAPSGNDCRYDWCSGAHVPDQRFHSSDLDLYRIDAHTVIEQIVTLDEASNEPAKVRFRLLPDPLANCGAGRSAMLAAAKATAKVLAERVGQPIPVFVTAP